MDGAGDFLNRVTTWCDDEQELELTEVRVGSVAKPRDFIDRDRGIAFRIHTADHPHDFFSPRHCHTFDQVRYMISGSCRYGDKTYVEGDCIYIPAGCTYGPMQLTESKENFKHFNMQYQGIANLPYYPPTAFGPARAALRDKGHFDHGVFVWKDGRRQDAFEALLEQTTGKPVAYPPAPYDEYLVVRGRNVAWVPVADQPGIAIKHLGHFTQVGPYIQVVRMAAGTRTPGGQVAHQEIRCVIGGRVAFEEEPGKRWANTSLRYIPPGVAYGATECIEEATIVIVRWAPDGQLYTPTYKL